MSDTTTTKPDIDHIRSMIHGAGHRQLKHALAAVLGRCAYWADEANTEQEPANFALRVMASIEEELGGAQ